VLEEQQFDLGRPDLVAARVDHPLEQVGHEEVALLVHAAEVAGAKELLSATILCLHSAKQ